jgi:hypothetical protein
LITSPTAGFVRPEETSVVALISFAANKKTSRVGCVLTGAGLVLLPWLGYLAATLPPAQAVAWVTLDALEAAALLTAGTRLLRGDADHRAPAAAAAVLLVTDACLDLATAATGQELATAVVMAVAAELPLAALCAVLARRKAEWCGMRRR